MEGVGIHRRGVVEPALGERVFAVEPIAYCLVVLIFVFLPA